MKKLLLLLLVFCNLALASDYELKLYEKVMTSIFKKTPIKVYADAKERRILRESYMFNVTSICDDTVMVIIGRRVKDLPLECQDTPIFATNYRVYKKNKNAFGAFYWRKGRPQLKLNKKRIQRFNLPLPRDLQKYIK